MRIVLLKLVRSIDLNNPISTGWRKIAKFYVMQMIVEMSWCQEVDVRKWRSQDYGFYSAVTLVAWSLKTKIVFLGPGMCLQLKTT